MQICIILQLFAFFDLSIPISKTYFLLYDNIKEPDQYQFLKFFLWFLPISFKHSSTICSVSGLGIKTFLLTKNSFLQNSFLLYNNWLFILSSFYIIYKFRVSKFIDFFKFNINSSLGIFKLFESRISASVVNYQHYLF